MKPTLMWASPTEASRHDRQNFARNDAVAAHWSRPSPDLVATMRARDTTVVVISPSEGGATPLRNLYARAAYASDACQNRDASEMSSTRGSLESQDGLGGRDG